MNVNFEYYKIFYYVARYHNFTKAAKVLGNSQPNVTRAMNCLEAAAWKDTICQDKQGCTAHKRRGTALFICGGCNVTASDGGG